MTCTRAVVHINRMLTQCGGDANFTANYFFCKSIASKYASLDQGFALSSIQPSVLWLPNSVD